MDFSCNPIARLLTNTMVAFGSTITISPNIPKLVVTPKVVGNVSIDT
jgi:hypothetical protein